RLPAARLQLGLPDVEEEVGAEREDPAALGLFGFELRHLRLEAAHFRGEATLVVARALGRNGAGERAVALILRILQPLIERGAVGARALGIEGARRSQLTRGTGALHGNVRPAVAQRLRSEVELGRRVSRDVD